MADSGVIVSGSYGTLSNSKPTPKNDNQNTSLIIREEDRFRLDTPYQDKLFAILFIIYLILIIILSIYFYVQNTDTYNTNNINDNNDYLNQHFWKLVIWSIIISILNSIFLLILLRKYTYYLIWITLILSLFIWIGFGIFIAISGSIFLSILIFLIIIIQIIWMYFIRSRIAFATALIILSIDSLNILASYTYFISFIGIIMQTIWLIIWMMGFSYSIDGTKSTESVIFLYIIAYYWTFQIIKNIVLCTICGCVAVWYFLYPSHLPNKPVFNSFKRSITTSFGSICYGSLIIAIIQTLRIILNILRSMIKERNNNICIQCIFVCIINGCLRCTLQKKLNFANSCFFVRMVKIPIKLQ